MAIDDAYASVEDFKQANKLPGTNDDAAIKRDLLTVSRLIDRRLGQFFTQDAAVVNRTFRAKWSDRVDLTYEGGCPGIATSTGLVVKVDTDGDESFADETAWASSDYELWPRNAALGPEARPYTDIRVAQNGAQSFAVGNLVQVTAIFGWPAVPEGIKDATIELTRIWRVEGPRGTGRINEDLSTVFNTSRAAMSIIDELLRAYMGKVTI